MRPAVLEEFAAILLLATSFSAALIIKKSLREVH